MIWLQCKFIVRRAGESGEYFGLSQDVKMDLLVDGDVIKLLALSHQLHGAGEPGPGHLGLGGVSGEELVTARILICFKTRRGKPR